MISNTLQKTIYLPLLLFLCLSVYGQSQYGRLLHQGVYTSTGVVRDNQSLAGCGQTSLTNFSIYEKAIIEQGKANPMYYSGDATVFGEYGRKYVVTTTQDGQVFYLVLNDGSVRFVATNGVKTLSMYIFQGDCRAQYTGKVFSTPINNGGNSLTPQPGNNYNQPPQTKQKLRVCTVCHGTGTCPICHGSAWVTNAFTGKLQKCGGCHGGKLCSSCGGTGRKAYW